MHVWMTLSNVAGLHFASMAYALHMATVTAVKSNELKGLKIKIKIMLSLVVYQSWKLIFQFKWNLVLIPLRSKP